jgi:hypothetical protein
MQIVGQFLRIAALTASAIGVGFSTYFVLALLSPSPTDREVRAIGVLLFAAAAAAAAYAGLRIVRTRRQDVSALAASSLFLAAAAASGYYTFLAYYYLAAGVVLVVTNLLGVFVGNQPRILNREGPRR